MSVTLLLTEVFPPAVAYARQEVSKAEKAQLDLIMGLPKQTLAKPVTVYVHSPEEIQAYIKGQQAYIDKLTEDSGGHCRAALAAKVAPK